MMAIDSIARRKVLMVLAPILVIFALTRFYIAESSVDLTWSSLKAVILEKQQELQQVPVAVGDDTLMDDDDHVTEPPEETTPLAHYENDKDTRNFVDALQFCKLPRTSEKMYNKLEEGKKYFTYSPSGGFSNQAIEFLTAIVIAKAFNRVLLVPPAAGHTSGYWNFEKLRGDFLVPMDTLVDFPYIEQKFQVELVPLTLQPWLVANWHKKKDGKTFKRISVAKENELTTRLKSNINHFNSQMAKANEYQLVMAHGRFYTKWWTQKDKTLFRHLRYAPYLRNIARSIVDAYYGTSRFVAQHIRLGDTRYSRTTSYPNVKYASSVLLLDSSTPTYILSDATKDDSFFDELKNHFSNITFAEDMETHPVIQPLLADFRERLSGNRIVNDVYGLVEELIAMQADWFVGTIVSTFARSIVAYRDNIGELLPEIDSASVKYQRDHLPRVSGLIAYGGVEHAYVYHHGFYSNTSETIRCIGCGMLF